MNKLNSAQIDEILHVTSRVSVVKNERKEFPFMYQELALSYPLLGKREYSHGSSMFEGMFCALKEFIPNFDAQSKYIKMFKVIREFSSESIACAMPRVKARDFLNVGEAVARLDLNISDEEYTCLLFQNDKEVVDRLTSYNASDYVQKIFTDDGNGFGDIYKIDDYVDLLRAVNESNRQLTVNSFPFLEWSKRVRWAYLSDFEMPPLEELHDISQVKFEPYDLIDMGQNRFEVKRGFLVTSKATYSFLICFFIALPSVD